MNLHVGASATGSMVAWPVSLLGFVSKWGLLWMVWTERCSRDTDSLSEWPRLSGVSPLQGPDGIYLPVIDPTYQLLPGIRGFDLLFLHIDQWE